MKSYIEVTLVEDCEEGYANRIKKSVVLDRDYLVLHEDVLPAFEDSIQEFGFIIPKGKTLGFVDKDKVMQKVL